MSAGAGGFMVEFLQNHTNVVSQRGFDERDYGGINPHALGFAMVRDIRRICEQPTEEDRHCQALLTNVLY